MLMTSDYCRSRSSFARKIGFGGPGHPQLIVGPFGPSCENAALQI
jgi:hypothetical protein